MILLISVTWVIFNKKKLNINLSYEPDSLLFGTSA